METLLPELATHLFLFVCAVAATILAAVSGGGAGFILLPVLILTGLPFLTALGTHKISMLMLGLSSLIKNHRHGVIKGNIAWLLILAGTPGVILGTYSVSLVDSQIVEKVLGIITIAMAGYSLFSKKLTSSSMDHNLSFKNYLTGGLAIFLVAYLSGSMSSGAGLFATMVLITLLKVDLKDAISYSMIFVAAFYNLIGAAVVGVISSISWHYLPSLLLGCFTGGYIGASLLNKLPVKLIKYLFCSVAALSGIMLLLA